MMVVYTSHITMITHMLISCICIYTFLPVSVHQKKKKATSEAWEGIRECLARTVIQEAAPATYKCAICEEMIQDIIWCHECGPSAYFCQSCCNNHHAIIALHQPQIWCSKVITIMHTSPEKPYLGIVF